MLIDVTDGQYGITLPTFIPANNTKIDNKSIGLVNFLFKVEEIVSGIVRFYWMVCRIKMIISVYGDILCSHDIYKNTFNNQSPNIH